MASDKVWENEIKPAFEDDFLAMLPEDQLMKNHIKFYWCRVYGLGLAVERSYVLDDDEFSRDPDFAAHTRRAQLAAAGFATLGDHFLVNLLPSVAYRAIVSRRPRSSGLPMKTSVQPASTL